MPVLRRCAANVSMRRSPNRMRPRSSSQNPATIRSNVVLPQPDGPSSVKNSPSRTAMDTSSTARTVPKVRATPSIVIAVTRDLVRLSARAPDDVLDLLRGFGAFLDPGVLVVVDELDLIELRHLPGKLRQIEILPRRPAEREAQDCLAHVLARHIVDELLGGFGVRTALDDRDAFNLRHGAIGRIDHLHGRAVRGPLITRIFKRYAECELAVSDTLENKAGTVEHTRVRKQARHLLPARLARPPHLR